jgi:hypothetical protein
MHQIPIGNENNRLTVGPSSSFSDPTGTYGHNHCLQSHFVDVDNDWQLNQTHIF